MKPSAKESIGQRRSRRVTRTLSARTCAVTALVGLTTGLWTSSATASEEYVDYLTQNYGYRESCLLCHATPDGLLLDRNKPFAVALYDLGMRGGKNIESLRTALEALPEGSDVDGDEWPDLEELADGGNPNNPNIVPGGLVPVEYGCSVNGVGANGAGNTNTPQPWALGLAAMVAAALLRSVRRRR